MLRIAPNWDGVAVRGSSRGRTKTSYVVGSLLDETARGGMGPHSAYVATTNNIFRNTDFNVNMK